MFDVAIIGGGVVGGLLARELSKYELRLCILEKENDVAMGATKANSAIVHAGFDAQEGTQKARLNVRGARRMPSLCEELGVKYKNNGSLVLGFSEEDRATLSALLLRGRENGVEGLEILEYEELHRLEPNLADGVLCALSAPTGAIVCPYELTVAAIGNAMDNGALLKCNFAVSSVEKIEGGYRLSSENESVEARYVANCAGLFSDEIARLFGDDSFDVHPRKGEYILLDTECGTLVSHTLFCVPTKLGKGILVTPTVDSNLLLGPTSVDREDKEDRDTTSEGFAAILSCARKMIKTVPVQKSITSFCGLRAAGDTGDFILKAKDGVVCAAGIESPGLSASPALAEELISLLQGEGLTLTEKADFQPRRAPMHAFREMSPDEKNEIIRKDASYGKIVCRCEGVSEGEILAAIRQNPRPTDLDGVKRRTRAQMGRCQGGFCSPYIVELLARELGIPFEDVTKFGGKSVVNVSKTKGGRRP